MNHPENNSSLEINSIKFSFDDIHRVVKSFYQKVPQHKHLRAPFTVVEDWPHHIERLTHFWWIRFGGRPYLEAQYNPVQKHYETGFSEELLDEWLALFKSVLHENLSHEQATLWMTFAEGMGKALNHNNELMKAHYNRHK